MGVLIRAARPDDVERLRELTYVSKAHWGYDPERVRRWVEDEFDWSHLRERWVAERDGEVVAWAGLIPGEPCVLDDLWVDPPAIGSGLGSELFRFACARARELGARRLEWEADANAVGFYERMGGAYMRDSTSEWGRTLPWMGLAL
jgi:N-acetylglutamate synthase-like GNAT family acetyltransferase